MKLVEAQEGRRTLDRLVGYEVSPVLWRRVGGARSAGRVQSVAVRLVVERERERMAFRARSTGTSTVASRRAASEFGARLVELDGQRVADEPRLRPGDRRARAGLRRRCTCARPTRVRSPAVSRDASYTVAYVGVEAVHRATEAAVQDDDDAAGGRATSCASAPAARCRSRRASTSVATSPTCVPTRSAVEPGGRRGPGPDRRAVRPGLPAAGAAHVREQDQERAGGPRGDPPVGRPLPHARRRSAGELSRDEQAAVRADLDAHGREPDDRRPRSQPHAAARRHVVERGEEAIFRASRHAPTSSSASAWRTST